MYRTYLRYHLPGQSVLALSLSVYVCACVRACLDQPSPSRNFFLQNSVVIISDKIKGHMAYGGD